MKTPHIVYYTLLHPLTQFIFQDDLKTFSLKLKKKYVIAMYKVTFYMSFSLCLNAVCERICIPQILLKIK